MRRGFALLGAVSLTFGLLWPQDAAAFCRTMTCDPAAGDACRKSSFGCIADGVPVKWPTSPIPYRLSPAFTAKLDKVAGQAAIRKAFDAWSSVQCAAGPTSLRFEQQTDLTASKPLASVEAPDKFGIYFRDDSWPHDDADESLGLTNQIFGKVSGDIDYADIEINMVSVTYSLEGGGPNEVDLQAVMTHQIGHYIGLAHSNDADSIMVARYCQAGSDRCRGGIDRARALADDDRVAVCALFPPGAVLPATGTNNDKSDAAGAHGCAAAPETRTDAAMLTALGGLALALALARRRVGYPW